MKSLSPILIFPTLVLLLTSCDAISNDVQSTERSQAINNVKKDSENKKSQVEISTKTIVDTDDVEVLTEWEPAMVNTPVSQSHKPFYLPASNAQKIRTYFYNDIDINTVKEKNR